MTAQLAADPGRAAGTRLPWGLRGGASRGASPCLCRVASQQDAGEHCLHWARGRERLQPTGNLNVSLADGRRQGQRGCQDAGQRCDRPAQAHAGLATPGPACTAETRRTTAHPVEPMQVR